MSSEGMMNSEGERITIEDRKLRGERVKCIVIWDDPPPRGSGIAAPMLLDKRTREWLRSQLDKLDEAEKTEQGKSPIEGSPQ